MDKLLPFLYVGIGGFIGANARMLVHTLFALYLPIRFPLGTFVINVLGSFVLGFVATLIAERGLARGEDVRYFVNVGLLGAFTTFSTFSFETVDLMKDGRLGMALLYVCGSCAMGLLGVRLGIFLARAWPT
jgi:CrcB protein